MSKEAIIQALNLHRPEYLNDLGCTITDADSEKGMCEMKFKISKQFCHSVDIIQGGFVTAMLDAVTTHAVFAANRQVRAVSTLEVKVNFYAPSRAGKLTAIGRVDKMTRNFVFVSGDLINELGERTASISSTAKVSV